MSLKHVWSTLILLGCSFSLQAAEVDQFTNDGSTLKDSKEAINQQINLYVSQAVANLNAERKGCDEKALYDELQKYLQNHMNGEIVDFLNDSRDVEKSYTTISKSIYRKWSMWDGFVLGRPGASTSPLAMSPLIKVNGQVIGIDKLEHLFDRGYAYFDQFYNDKDSIEETLINGVWWEKALYGGKKWGTGVFSYGDLAANFNGLRFWNDVLGKNRDLLGRKVGPYLACEHKMWVKKNRVDISKYIDASYDESINCSKFTTEKTTNKVLTELGKLKKSCPMSTKKLAEMDKKYGYYSRFVLNKEGMESSESVYQWRKKLGIETGWKPVPGYFNPLFKWRYKDLEYNADAKYLRNFRYKDDRGDHEKDTSLSWSSIRIKEDYPDKKLINCWYIFLSGGDCRKPVMEPLPSAYTEKGTLDLLSYARDVSKQSGLVRAREVVEQKFVELDASKGELKKKVIQTTLNKDLTFEGSFATIPKEKRSRIGVYLVLGIGGDNSDNAQLIRNAANEVSRLGFQSEMLEVDPNLGSDYNAALLKIMLEDRLPNLDKVVLVAASKGASDFITYFLNYGKDLPLKEREKIKMMVTLSGVVRSSFVADYLSHSNGPLGLAVRNFLKASGRGEILKGVESLAQDPWEGHDPTTIKKLFPDLTWVSFPSIPEAKTALTDLSLWAGFLRTPVHSWSHIASPSDGLVESAAAILPPDTGLTEIVIPIHGPHEMALGSYEPGVRIAPIAQGDIYDAVIPASGPEILSALFRAFPRTLIDE